MKHTLMLALSFLFLLNCGSSTTTSDKTPSESGLSDANIAAIVVGANKIDISAEKLAIERSENQDVKDFA